MTAFYSVNTLNTGQGNCELIAIPNGMILHCLKPKSVWGVIVFERPIEKRITTLPGHADLV